MILYSKKLIILLPTFLIKKKNTMENNESTTPLLEKGNCLKLKNCFRYRNLHGEKTKQNKKVKTVSFLSLAIVLYVIKSKIYWHVLNSFRQRERMASVTLEELLQHKINLQYAASLESLSTSLSISTDMAQNKKSACKHQ